MYRKLIIFVLVALATQLPYDAFAKQSPSSSHNKTEHSISKLSFRPPPDAEATCQQIHTAVRSVSVQKDSGHGCICLLKLPFCFSTYLPTPVVATSIFSKSYIDHIYPSHHFW